MVYLLLQRVTGIFNTTGNGNSQVTISIFLISDFKNSVISNKISGGVYEIWQHLVTPWA